jgi:hypothetical protein
MSELYRDGRIICDEEGITIRNYGFPVGTKRIPYASIKGVTRRPLSRMERWRVWGSNDFRHWFNLDVSRPRKSTGFVLDTGKWTRAVITPDDVDAVGRVLDEHVGTGADRVPT